jgi:hypothetical protein
MITGNDSQGDPQIDTNGASKRRPLTGKPQKSIRISRTAKSKNDGRRRGRKPYPVITFDEALRLGQGLMEHGAGHPMRRVTLLEKLKLSDNQSTRNLITSSGKYGITQGSFQAEELRLTPTGRLAVDPAASVRQRTQAQFELAIKDVQEFFRLYDRFKDGKLPAPEVLRDSLGDLDPGDRPQCVDIFISNSKTVGVLQTVEGAPHLYSLEAVLDRLPAQQTATRPQAASVEVTEGSFVDRKPNSER